MARANVKTEMKGTGVGRWTTREDAKKSSKRIRRENDKSAADEASAQWEFIEAVNGVRKDK
jgi:hypothetical protein